MSSETNVCAHQLYNKLEEDERRNIEEQKTQAAKLRLLRQYRLLRATYSTMMGVRSTGTLTTGPVEEKPGKPAPGCTKLVTVEKLTHPYEHIPVPGLVCVFEPDALVAHDVARRTLVALTSHVLTAGVLSGRPGDIAPLPRKQKLLFFDLNDMRLQALLPQ